MSSSTKPKVTMSSFTKLNLASAIHGAFPTLTQEACKNIVDAVFLEISARLINGEKCEFRDFGVFSTRVREARIGRNPANPAAGPVQVPRKVVVKFKAGKALASQLNAATEPAQNT